MSSKQWTSVISCEGERQSRYQKTKFMTQGCRYISTYLHAIPLDWEAHISVYNISLRQDSEGVLLAFSPESKLLLVELINRDGVKGIFQVKRYIASTRKCVNLLKQRNHIWHKICNQSHHFVKLMIIYHHSLRSICFLYRPNR